jgi:hypothetical protein
VRLIAGLLNQTAGQYEKALEDYRRVQDLEPHQNRDYDSLRVTRKGDRCDALAILRIWDDFSAKRTNQEKRLHATSKSLSGARKS